MNLCDGESSPLWVYNTISNQADSPSCWTESSWLVPELCFIHHTVGSRQCTWFCDCTVILLFYLLCIYYVVFCVFAAHVFIQCCAAHYCQGLVIVNVIFQDWFSAHNKPTHPLYDRHKLPRCSLWAAEHMIVMIVRRCRARRGLKEKVTDVSCLQMTWALSGKVSSKRQVKATDCTIMSADWSLNSEPSYQHKQREMTANNAYFITYYMF